MTSFDTNLAVYAANTSLPGHLAARRFLMELAPRKDVVVCELMLVELYLKLRNQKIFPMPMSAPMAVAFCDQLRQNRNWAIVETGPVMAEVWPRAAADGFAFRRIINLRLALVLRHHGVTDFATANTRDFQDVGFSRVWNPIAPAGN